MTVDPKDKKKRNLVKIGKIAEEIGVLPSTIRYYTNLGLLKTYGRTQGGFRLYDYEETLHRLKILKQLEDEKRYTLDEIKGKLDECVLQAKQRKVLIVDDDPDVRDLIQSVLSSDPGWIIRTAGDGFEAGKLAIDFLPELIILDIVLPGMDGFKVCADLRKDERFKSTVIIAITGYDTQEHRDRIAAAGADGFVAKPITPNALRECVAKFLPQK
ncbi:MAG: response regulator [Elusimicrobiota bacterium]